MSLHIAYMTIDTRNTCFHILTHNCVNLYDLHLCERCCNSTPKLLLPADLSLLSSCCSQQQKRGLTQHINAHHKPTTRSQVNPQTYNNSNLSTIRNVFRIVDSETNAWAEALLSCWWLLTLTPYPQPSFRVSLYSKLSSQLHLQVVSALLNWLLIIYNATTSTDFDKAHLPEYNASTLPLL